MGMKVENLNVVRSHMGSSTESDVFIAEDALLHGASGRVTRISIHSEHLRMTLPQWVMECTGADPTRRLEQALTFPS